MNSSQEVFFSHTLLIDVDASFECIVFILWRSQHNRGLSCATVIESNSCRLDIQKVLEPPLGKVLIERSRARSISISKISNHKSSSSVDFRTKKYRGGRKTLTLSALDEVCTEIWEDKVHSSAFPRL
jgi:hypothetical protein